VAKAAALLPVPEGVPDEVAAQLVAMPFSAISLLDSLDLTEGDWMIQNAANGAVGRLVAQLAPARGIHVIGLVRRADGVAELAAAGIENVVATDADGWQDKVREIVGDSPIKVGIDSVGGDSSGDVLSMLGENGTLVSFGAMASPTMSIASGDVIFKQATVKGFWGSKVSAAMPAEDRRRLMGELFARLGDGTISLPVGGIYPLSDISAAADANFEPGRAGKILLTP